MRIPWPFVGAVKLIRLSAAFVRAGVAALALVSTEKVRSSDPLGTLVPTTVEVPSPLRRAPFNRERQLLVPPGFTISVVARIPRARFILPVPAGGSAQDRSDWRFLLVVRPVCQSLHQPDPP
jgi:hypothetical protein